MAYGKFLFIITSSSIEKYDVENWKSIAKWEEKTSDPYKVCLLNESMISCHFIPGDYLILFHDNGAITKIDFNCEWKSIAATCGGKYLIHYCWTMWKTDAWFEIYEIDEDFKYKTTGIKTKAPERCKIVGDPHGKQFIYLATGSPNEIHLVSFEKEVVDTCLDAICTGLNCVWNDNSESYAIIPLEAPDENRLDSKVTKIVSWKDGKIEQVEDLILKKSSGGLIAKVQSPVYGYNDGILIRDADTKIEIQYNSPPCCTFVGEIFVNYIGDRIKFYGI